MNDMYFNDGKNYYKILNAKIKIRFKTLKTHQTLTKINSINHSQTKPTILLALYILITPIM